MAGRGGAVHVATTTRHYKGRVYQTHLLRRTYRENGKVNHQTLGNLSHLPRHVIELIRRALRGEAVVPAHEAFQIQRSLPHGHVAATLGTLRAVGLDTVLAAKRSRPRDLVVAMMVARLLAPRSKLATARGLDPQTLHSTLGEVLGVEAADADELYAAMDWLLARQGRIEAALAQRYLAEGTLVLYDVTSVAFEGRHCPLAKLGYDRHGKTGTLQIVFGLLCNAAGCPVAVEVFEGNTGDPKTLASQVQKIRARFRLKRLVLVGDRGMITAARIREDLQPIPGLAWITALRASAIRPLVESGTLQLSLFDDVDLAEITTPDYPGERLIVCKNPLLAEERARKRQALLEATARALAKIAEATQRPHRPLRGREQIGLRVGKVLGRFKVAKHFHLEITEERLRYERDEARIAQEAALDGIYVIRTSVPATELGAAEAVRAYKRLATVERAFRSLKAVDLKVRPVYHHLADRVRAHVFLCMLTYYVEWHMRRALAPLLFDDDDPAAAEALRASVVAPARRSPTAERKARTLQTDDGLPVCAFQDLLAHLATLCKNRILLMFPGAVAFDQYTVPSALQQKAFQLLGVAPTKM